jgi:hypothetical protein
MRPFLLIVLTASLAYGSEFTNSWATSRPGDQDIRAMGSTVTNDSTTSEDVFVFRGGIRQKIGSLEPGEHGNVVVIPHGDSNGNDLFIFNK